MYGWASTPIKDAQDEVIIQKGLNLSPMLTSGWVNFDHDRTQIIGYPTAGEIKDNPKTMTKGLYVEYELFKGLPRAEMVWSLAKALKDSGAPRSLGLSIEGKKKEVSSKGVILKADVYGFAVTPYPVNPETSTSILLKSMLTPDSDEASKQEVFAKSNLFDVSDSITEFKQAVETFKKAIATGHDVGGTTQTNGSSLRKESMDSDLVRLATFNFEEPLLKKMPKSYVKAIKNLYVKSKSNDFCVTKAEATLILHLLGYPLDLCIETFDL